MDDFISNLIYALGMVRDILWRLSFDIGDSVQISLLDVVTYGSIISITLYAIKEMGDSGLFNSSPERRERLRDHINASRND